MFVAASALLALLPLQAGAQDAGTADTGDFVVKTGQDLLDLCSADRSSPLYAEAIQGFAGSDPGHTRRRSSSAPASFRE